MAIQDLDNVTDSEKAEYIISAKSQTRRAILESIKSFLISVENEEKWYDFFESSVGKTLLNIISGMTEMLMFKVETRARESYLLTAQTQSAVFLLSQALGYNPNRKKHSTGKVEAQIKPYAENNFIIPKHTQLEGEVPLVVKENISVEAQTQVVQDIPVMQGEWKEIYIAQKEEYIYQTYNLEDKEIDYTIKTNLGGKDWEFFQIDEEDFSIDQLQLYVEVNGDQLNIVDKVQLFNMSDNEISKINTLSEEEQIAYIKENSSLFLDQNFLMLVDSNSVMARTDYNGGVFLLFGDGNFGKRLNSSSVIKIKYLKTKGSNGYLNRGIDLGSYNISEQIIDFKTQSLIQGGTDEDSVDKVRYLAPKFFHTQGRAVTKYDYEAVAMSYPGVVSAKADKLEECCTICLSVLKQGAAEWTDQEKAEFMDYMDKYKMVSLFIDFWEPEPVSLDMTVKVIVNEDINISEIDELIRSRILLFCHKLGQTFYGTKLLDSVAGADSRIKRVYFTEINGRSDYPDLELPCYGYFELENIDISISKE